jgi:hypothetical protein
LLREFLQIGVQKYNFFGIYTDFSQFFFSFGKNF